MKNHDGPRITWFAIATSIALLTFCAEGKAAQSDDATAARLKQACAELRRLKTTIPACKDSDQEIAGTAGGVPGKQATIIGGRSGSAPSDRMAYVQTSSASPGAAIPGVPFVVLRQDQYDEVSYILGPNPGQVPQGASLSFTKDQIAKTQSAQIKGLLGVSVLNGFTASAGSCDSQPDYQSRSHNGALAGYGFGGFLLADGNYSEPTTKTEKSALRAGLSADLLFCNSPVFPYQDFQFLPYVQTDFRGKAGMAGFDAIWEPTDINNLLGGRSEIPAAKAFAGYYVRLYGESNVFDVQNAGLTNFTSRTVYAFLGGTAEVRAVLFENNPDVPDFLCGRVSLIGTARYMWDAIAQKPAYLYGAEIDYNIFGQPFFDGKMQRRKRHDLERGDWLGRAVVQSRYRFGDICKSERL